MTSTTITFAALTTGASYGIVSIPGTNYVYYANQTNQTGIYYYDSTAPSSTILFLTVTDGTNTASSLNGITTGVYSSNRYLWAFESSSGGFIWQILLNNDGTPGAITRLVNSTGSQGFAIAYDGNSSVLYTGDAYNNIYQYDLSTTTMSSALSTIGSFSGIIESMKYINGSLYVTSTGQGPYLFKGQISGGTVTWSQYLTGFTTAGFITDPDISGTVYLTDYTFSGGSINIITNFLTSPNVSPFPFTPTSVANGFWSLTFSNDFQYLYITNYDAGATDQIDQIAVIPLNSGPIPCFTEECELLTPQGYVRVDELKEGSLVVTPDRRHLPIERIYSSSIFTTKETAPFRIPKDFFEDNVPSKDVVISPHHAYKIPGGEWTIPVWTPDLKQESIRKSITYYHLQLANYAFDKLVCSGLTVDSWDGQSKIKF